MIVYDIEVEKAIPPHNDEDRLEGIEYCEGWHDHENMGVAVIGAYDVARDRYRVFTKGNFDSFEELITGRTVVGFNSVNFDDMVCRASGIAVLTRYDLLLEVWNACGLGSEYKRHTHGGYGLDALARANNVGGKTGRGDLAPVDWQRGRYGKVIDYCLQDVRLTYRLIHRVQNRGWLRDTKSNKLLNVSAPSVYDRL